MPLRRQEENVGMEREMISHENKKTGNDLTFPRPGAGQRSGPARVYIHDLTQLLGVCVLGCSFLVRKRMPESYPPGGCDCSPFFLAPFFTSLSIPAFFLSWLFFVGFVCFYGEMADGRARSAGRRGARAQPAPGRDARSATGFFYGEMGRILWGLGRHQGGHGCGRNATTVVGHFSAALTSPEGHSLGRAGILKDAGLAKFWSVFRRMYYFSGKRKEFW